MATLPPYLRDRADRIRELQAQALPPYPADYRAWKQDVMQRLYQRFPDWTIQRNDLTTLYQEWQDLPLALVATLVWGLIDTKKKQRLQQVLALGDDVLAARMIAIRDEVRAGHFGDAFESCCVLGENCIPGIGMSYFTKVFFFIGETTPNLKRKPLILDKWTTNAFFALLGQNLGSQPLRRYFTFPSAKSLKKYKAVPLKTGTDLQLKVYLLYIRCMTDWSGQLGVSPSKLEQFVFGTDLRQDRSATNPRREILDIIRTLIV